MNQPRNRVALVGGNRRGLEILTLLGAKNIYDSILVVEPDRGALIYHLKDYGFAFSDSLRIELTPHLADLKSLIDLHLIIDASGNPNLHRDLYQLETGVEIVQDSVFH